MMRYDGTIVENVKIAADIWHMNIDAGKVFHAKPGQFINILVSDAYAPLLRRPFSIFDAGKKNAEIVYKVIGGATRLLSEKKQGDKLNFLGPLGGSYLNSELGTRNSELLLAGGGTGIASIHFLAKELKKKKIKFSLFQGAKTKSEIIMPQEFKKLGCVFTTDDGSYGEKGFVTDLVEKQSQVPNPKSQGKTKHASRSTLHAPQEKNFTVFACGPKPMLIALKELADKKNIKVFASFEEYMGCGIGACLSCAIEIKKGDYMEYKRVCSEGTVFNLKDIVF
jgi:dihydroorotate dehydrogenase electron transfer subunit